MVLNIEYILTLFGIMCIHRPRTLGEFCLVFSSIIIKASLYAENNMICIGLLGELLTIEVVRILILVGWVKYHCSH